ncbi:PH domain-containing protein [Sporosarcina sp. ACRSM]|uniref:PH domain-containing protein n=1 Tax=Sporosarcina sp. ACRSM TaxID=2918216 RepID=UPI001EF54DC9|nr:PH domain-containing protein [Sporosarcina sp. ACRSM]MCG7334128.1 PH domain-containing protein [Sporosarcina sp. ACRSM]
MTSTLNAPQKRLAKEAIKVWLISDMIANLIGFLVLGILFYLDIRFSWKEWIRLLLIILTVFALIGGVWSLIHPFLSYKNWRYDADEQFLQLKLGAIKEMHQLVPMTKIQSVATEQGPLLRRYGLCSVSVETMGSSHTIPALPKRAAIELRNQIATYAKIKEVEQ